MGRARSFDEQDILERATQLFWRHGYNGTSMRELVDATGLAKASLYNAFGSKEEIFLTVLDYYINEKQTQAIAPLVDERLSGREAIQTYFNNVKHATLNNRKTPGCLLINTAAEQAIHDPDMRDVIDRGMSRTEAHLAKAVQRGIEDGSIAPETDPAQAGFCLVNMVISMRILACRGTSEDKLTSLIRANIDAHAPATQNASAHH